MSYSYSRSNLNSILTFAALLKGKTLREICDIDILENTYTGKGNFGQLLEKYYFKYEPNSLSEPDFHEVGLELKTSPLKKNRNNHLSAKERLVLSIINYFDIVQQEFISSTFYQKNNHILLILYLHESNVDVLDFIIKLVGDWKLPQEDLAIIKNDWEYIRNKIKSGRAHELSEGDTFYLGACTKGGKGGNPRPQPFSDIPAKQRAFSLKQGYLNHIIGRLSQRDGENYGKIINTPIQALNFEDIVISKFQKYYDKTTLEIEAQLGITLNNRAKSYYASLSKKILGIDINKEIEEFTKADIIVKSVRLKENNLPKESISFQTFKYTDLLNEDWEDSNIKSILEHKFLFIFYQFKEGNLILKKARFWNMSATNIDSVKQVWEKTKELVSNGNIVSEIVNGKRKTNFPNKSFHKIAHVRPHAKDSNDTYPLPVPDRLTGESAYTKHCFWLNDTYIKDEIYLK